MQMMQYRSQPQNLEGAKKILGGSKMLDFRQITLFCLGYHLSKHKKWLYVLKIWGGPWRPLGYTYELISCDADLNQNLGDQYQLKTE